MIYHQQLIKDRFMVLLGAIILARGGPFVF